MPVEKLVSSDKKHEVRRWLRAELQQLIDFEKPVFGMPLVGSENNVVLSYEPRGSRVKKPMTEHGLRCLRSFRRLPSRTICWRKYSGKL